MTKLFLLTALAILPALPVLAQRGRPADGGSSRRLDYLAGYLELSDTQKQQAQSIFDAAEQAKTTLGGQLNSSRDALRAAAKANQSDAELDRLAAATGALEGQLAAIDAKAFSKFYALLTADQKTKHDEMGNRAGAGRGPGAGFRRR